MTGTLVIQSHRTPLPARWMEKTIHSVKTWTASRHYDYRFLGDELFDALPSGVLRKTRTQPVVATDLARLKALQSSLRDGYQTVIWCDADFLIFLPGEFDLPPDNFGLGREVWIQRDSRSGKPRAYVKVHNAFLFFRKGNAFLDFYLDSAERLINTHEGPFAPQFLGPKLLTAIHNIVQCPVVESAGMLSPLVMKDLLNGSGPFLDLFREHMQHPIAAANLCGSLTANGEMSDHEMSDVIDLLLTGMVHF
jgi:hypothetical protein